MYLFLDIDGVLVPAKSWSQPSMLDDGFYQFSAIATQVLKSVITKETTIVLTSTLRNRFSIDTWKKLFKTRGIEITSLLITPANDEQLSRKDELLHWFQLNDIDSAFAIIDDDSSLHDLPEFLHNHLISPASTVGLVESQIVEIQTILSSSFQLA